VCVYNIYIYIYTSAKPETRTYISSWLCAHEHIQVRVSGFADEVCINVKRDLVLRKKRPSIEEKET